MSRVFLDWSLMTEKSSDEVVFHVHGEALAVLHRIAAIEDSSLKSAMQNAISTYMWMLKKQLAGNHFILKSPLGIERILTLRLGVDDEA